MNNQKIFCGICGKSDEVSLLRHIRDEHNLTPEAYQARCPGAPLFTAEFGEYLRDTGVHNQGGNVMRMHELFGVKTPRTVATLEHVPAADGKFAFDQDIGKAVLSSLLANDRILLVGPTGSGKSSLIAQLAARFNWPLRRVNLHGETGVSDFIEGIRS